MRDQDNGMAGDHSAQRNIAQGVAEIMRRQPLNNLVCEGGKSVGRQAVPENVEELLYNECISE